MVPTLPPLIQELCNPSLHGSQTVGVRVVETHISWVLLTGETAYKIKKPVNFGFLDFSTLALRQRFCQEELRLNRRLAPFLYEAVVAITGKPGQIGFDGSGPALEYAVKMKQFDESSLADRLLEQNRLTTAQIDVLAQTLADFHGKADCAEANDPHGGPKKILAAAEHNFDHLLRLCGDRAELLNDLLSWTKAEFARLSEVFQARKNAGFVRECHGDLHSGNLVLLGGILVPFDCIEFSEDLRWIDCMNDIAFLFMDIDERGWRYLAWRLLNRYVELSGDYPGLQILNFYCVYRALVRAKVVALSLGQAADPGEQSRLKVQCHRYLDYALDAIQQKAPVLLITHGFSGSGKSTVAKALSERLPAIRIGSDIQRKRLAGLDAQDRSQSKLQHGIYSPAMTRNTYGLLLRHAEILLQSGFNVLLDATYLVSENRRHCRELANRLGVGFVILDFRASEAVLSSRIAERLLRGDDPSEASQEVLALQATKANPLQAEEIPFTLAIDTSGGMDIDEILLAAGIGD